MMCRVALDADALLDHKHATRRDMNIHRTLTKTLFDYGFIEALGKNDAVALLEAIEQLSPDARERWGAVLVALDACNRLRRGEGHQTVRELVNVDHLPEDLHETLDLIVVSETAAERQHLPLEVGFAQREREPELCVAESFTNCATVERVQRLRGRGNFPPSTAREAIWKAVFALPAELSTEATLLDRYFLNDLLRGRGRGRDHAEWFIRALDRTMAHNSSLRLLCEVPADGNPPKPLTEEKLKRAVRDRIIPIVGRGRLAKLEVVLAPWFKLHEDAPHNRHLRFLSGVAITTPEGFDRLDKQEVAGIDGFSWSAVTSASMLGDLGKREDVILRHRDTRVFQAL